MEMVCIKLINLLLVFINKGLGDCLVGKKTCHASMKNQVQIPRTCIKPDDPACVNNSITPIRKWGSQENPWR